MIQIDVFAYLLGLFGDISAERAEALRLAYDITLQGIGLLSLICSLISFQMKRRGAIMVFQMAASLLFSLQLFLLGAVTGACLDLISFVRTLIFSFRDKYKWASVRVWPIMFIITMIATGILTWDRWYSFLAIMGSVLSTVALWMRNGKGIRFVSLAVGPCWFIYNMIAGSYTGAINEVIAVPYIILGIIRHDVKFKRKKRDGEIAPEAEADTEGAKLEVEAEGATLEAESVTLEAEGVTLEAEGVTLEAESVTLEAVGAKLEDESVNGLTEEN